MNREILVGSIQQFMMSEVSFFYKQHKSEIFQEIKPLLSNNPAQSKITKERIVK